MYFLKLFVAYTFLVQSVRGFSSGAAGCEGEGPAIGGEHLNTLNGKTSTRFAFESKNVVVKVGGVTIPVNGSISVPTGTPTEIVVTGNNIKGVLMRFSGPIGYPTAGIIAPLQNTRTANACAKPAVGITHTAANDKDLVSGQILFTRKTGTELVKLDLTIVWFNSDKVSQYSYGQYLVTVTQGPPNNAPTPPPVAPPKCGFGTFKTAGSTTVYPVSLGWATEYNKVCKAPIVVAGAGGSSAGVKGGCNESLGIEVAQLSRVWKSSEATDEGDGFTYKCVIGTVGRTFSQVEVAVDGVPIIIERLNGTSKDCIDKIPGKGLTVNQLRWIFSNLTNLETADTVPFNDGNPATRKWNELNKDCPNKEIIPVGPSSIYGTFDFFREVIFTSQLPVVEGFREGYVTFADNSNEMRNYLLNTDGSIGYLGYSYYFRNQLSLLAIPIEGVEPSKETLEDDSYAPLGRRIFNNFLKTDESIKKTKCWLEYGLSETGASIVEQTGFLPVPREEYPQLLNRLPGSCLQAPVALPVPVPMTVPVPVPVVPVPVPTAPVPVAIAPVPRTCFSALSTVESRDEGIVSIADVKVGDYVKTSNGRFTQVYSLGHKDKDLENDFLQLHFSTLSNLTDMMSTYSSDPIEISARHLIFVERNGRQYPTRAEDVKIGDKLTERVVTSILKVTRRGVYAPITQSGDLAVNGVIVSSYVDLLDYNLIYDQHIIGHALFAPQRMFCSWFMSACEKEIYVDGLSPVAWILVGLSKNANDLGLLANMILGLVSIPFVILMNSAVALGFIGITTWYSLSITRRSA